MKSFITARRTSILQTLFILAVIGVSIWAGISTITAEKRPTQGQTNQEYQEVLTHLEVISRDIHPSGSQQIEEVRNYIISEAEALGYDVEIEPFTVEDRNGNERELANLLVHIDQKNASESVMFVSHYDGTDGGPAAGDDGIGVASMLSAMKYISRKNDLKNDIYFLITDGEEMGLEGASYFVRSHTDLMNDVKLVANFEARGNSGALLMFQTSRNNRNIVKMLQNSLQQFAGYAFVSELYKHMNNDTDLSEFLNAGWPGVNFAVLSGAEVYHMPEDTCENLNKDTGYMYYNTCRNLIDTLSVMDLSELEADQDVFYFPLLQSLSISYSKLTANLTQIILCVSVIALMAFMIGKRQISFRKVLLSIGLTLGTMIATSILVFLMNMILNQVLIKYGYIHVDTLKGLIEARETTNIILTALILCLAGVIFSVTAKKFKNIQELMFGTILLLEVGVIATMVVFPSISFLFSVPLFAMFLCTLIHYLVRVKAKGRSTAKATAYLTIAITIFMIIVIMLPVLVLVFESLFVYLPFVKYAYYLAAFLGFVSCCIIQTAAGLRMISTIEENMVQGYTEQIPLEDHSNE